MNRNARDTLRYTENSLDDQDGLNDSGNTDLQLQESHPSTIQYLDLIQADLFDDIAPFDFNDITTSTPDQLLDEPNPLYHGLFPMDATNLISPALNRLLIHSSNAMLNKTPELGNSSSLGIEGNANAQWPLTPVLGEWFSAEPTVVLSRECETVALAASGDVTSSAPVTGHSARRRPRSPSPDDIEKKMASSMFCFRVEVPESSSSRPAKKMRKPNDDQRRKEIAQVRKKGACLRCRLQSLKCDKETPCSDCVRVSGEVHLCKAICERFNLRESIAFRIGNSKFNQETATVRPYPNWTPSSAPRVMTLMRPGQVSSNWPKGDGVPTLQVLVREFIPSSADITAERWRSATTAALLDWVDNNFEYYARDMTSQTGDFLIGVTFDEALRYVSKNPNSMVKSALQLWVGARMAQEFFCIVENNDFNIDVVDDANSIHHGQCPIPPVLDHQLDVLMIQEMIRIKDQIMSEIERILKGRHSRSKWFEVYLTIFVLLTNLQFMQRYVFSAQNLVSHFRYGLKGPVPFTLDWDKENVKKLGELDKDGVKYVKYVSAIVQRRMDEFRENAERVKRNEFKGDMFWLSQLFVDPNAED
ncbi:uncharacterized protein FTJAE_13444 [Fusarium tjaetaba]|uniref:Zn(2)-C6 fungal-type domain-containing protein n=1 Tax=Fusarium tjaetaba TaxID=1567544 RepID=A0A8H5V971_9HYPO|nr:uncharacterized protein FTJAE_13444 [Fusarium tjaetaba]KAF5615121.1 hypothetical protein FTJAE_13444 [Fusarium tjaetaba]